MLGLAKNSLRLLAIGLPIIAASSAFAIDLPSDFESLDRNKDQEISFSEFSAHLRSQNISPTLAAQHFVKISAGDAVITRTDFERATTRDKPARSSEGYVLQPMTEDISDVDRADLTAMEPVESEQTMFEKTPNEEVAGEVVRAFEDNRWTDDLIRIAMTSEN